MVNCCRPRSKELAILTDTAQISVCSRFPVHAVMMAQRAAASPSCGPPAQALLLHRLRMYSQLLSLQQLRVPAPTGPRLSGCILLRLAKPQSDNQSPQVRRSIEEA